MSVEFVSNQCRISAGLVSKHCSTCAAAAGAEVRCSGGENEQGGRLGGGRKSVVPAWRNDADLAMLLPSLPRASEQERETTHSCISRPGPSPDTSKDTDVSYPNCRPCVGYFSASWGLCLLGGPAMTPRHVGAKVRVPLVDVAGGRVEDVAGRLMPGELMDDPLLQRRPKRHWWGC